MNFTAIDVETANTDLSSICQIGLAKFTNGILVDEWMTYVNPEDYFDSLNVSIHGISQSTVKDAPTFLDVFDKLKSFLENEVVVSHTHFDRVSILKAIQRYNMDLINCVWLDSARVARRTWKEFSWKGYGLYNICQTIGYEFNHHDALEDAKASAHILLVASKISDLNVNDWIKRVQQPIDLSTATIKRDGNPEGAFHGEVLVFTGALVIPRREAAELASSAGFQVASKVTQETTYLVLGDQDISKLAGHEKSSKHRRAEELIEKGFQIHILKESDFQEIINLP